MTNKSYNAVVDYLDYNKIHIDKEEFKLQLESHPESSSILAFSDTLNFFNIKNYGYKIDNNEKEILPNEFLTLIDGELAFIKNKNDKYFINGASANDFFSKWENVILVVEQEKELTVKKSKINPLYITSGIIGILCIFLFWYDFSNIILKLVFVVTSFIGVTLAYEAYKKTNGKGTFIPVGVCQSSYLNTDCDFVFNSKKWKIFTKIDLSEVSIVFFTIQILGFVLFSLIKNIEFFFYIYKYSLLSFIPMAFISFYYQIFVVKKYCPICVAIIICVFVQLITANLVFFTIPKINGTVIFLFSIFSSIAVLYNFKSKDIIGKKNENELKKNLKFKRNYAFFKNNLALQKKLSDTDFSNAFIFGNENANKSITLVTSPFCKHCKEFYPIFFRLIKKHSQEMKFNIFFDANLDKNSSEHNSVYINLTSIYINSKIEFLDALGKWYELQEYTKNKKSWYENYSRHFSFQETVKQLLYKQRNWCDNNSIYFTPNMFINEIEYPSEYERKDIEYFILEILSEN